MYNVIYRWPEYFIQRGHLFNCRLHQKGCRSAEFNRISQSILQNVVTKTLDGFRKHVRKISDRFVRQIITDKISANVAGYIISERHKPVIQI